MRILAEDEGESDVPLGLLTSMQRDSWADERDELLADSTNAASLHDLDSSMFAVSLTRGAPEENTDLLRCMLFGDARDRWFDKSFQLIVTENAKAAVNFEHAWGDGLAVLR